MSNIIKDIILSGDSKLIVSSLNQINNAIEDQNYENVHFALEKLRNELDRDIARRIYAGKKGAYNTLLKLMKACLDNATIIKAALKAITSLMTGNPDLLNDEGIAFQIQ